MKYKVPASILGLAALTIPVRSIAAEGDSLYGKPDSLNETVGIYKEESLTRLYIGFSSLSDIDKSISEHVVKMYTDESYANDFMYNKSEIYSSLGVNINDVENDPNLKLLEIVSLQSFRRATLERDYLTIVQIMIDFGLLQKDDFSTITNKYAELLEYNKDYYKKELSDQLVSPTSFVANSEYVIRPRCTTCVSFVAVAVNAVAATNVALAVIAVVYAGIHIWGPVEPADPNLIGIADKFGSIALMDKEIYKNKAIAKNVATIAGFDGIDDYIYRDLAKAEVSAFYVAAYTVGLIPNKDLLDEIINMAILEINKKTFRPSPTSSMD
ncbi:hypothetical protein ACMYQ1_10425 [Shewanella oncorhynchi]|uniref:hypothetical protein n=1 Tax=Shewanella oncorhynchi TaxID=2726434 RepID=UPI0039EEF34A